MIVKNNKVSTDTWAGQEIAAGATYEIEEVEFSRWQTSTKAITDLISGDLTISSDGATFKQAGQKAVNFLLRVDSNPKDTDGALLVKMKSFTNADGFRFRGASFSGSVSANSTADIDYCISAERHINGGRLLLDNIGNSDKMTFQVIDKDNVLGYGANVVLDEFIKDYFIPIAGNLEVRLDYPAKINAGLYLRLKYTSTHASGCNVKVNLYLHWKA